MNTTNVFHVRLEAPDKKPGSKKVRVWDATIENEKGSSYVLKIVHGLDVPKVAAIPRVFAAGKSKRTAVEQAMLECNRLAQDNITKKGYRVVSSALDEAYAREAAVFLKFLESRDDDGSSADAAAKKKDEIPHVMLAQKFEDVIHEFVAPQVLAGRYRIHQQPKLDGIFCMANLATGELYSRARKPLDSDNLGHIKAAVKILSPGKDVWIVGELYKHGLSFQAICSIVRTQKKEAKRKRDDVIEFHVFDVITPSSGGSGGSGFSARRKFLEEEIFSASCPPDAAEVIKLVPSHVVPQGDDSDDTFASIRAGHMHYTGDLKYEGSMIHIEPVDPREQTVGYVQNKRVKWLLKLKDFLQEEFRVVDIVPKKNCDSEAGSVILAHPDGRTFFSAIKMSDQMKVHLLKHKDKYVGAIATVSFFNYTDGNIPRFPQLIGFRHPDDR